MPLRLFSNTFPLESGVRIGAFEFRPSLVPSLAALVLLPVLLWLGVWQLDRAEQKRELIAAFNQRAHDAPMTLDGTQLDVAAMSYRRVRLQGRYLPARQLLVDNRIFHSRPGYYVLTPFRLAGSERVVLINRGWVALGTSREMLPKVGVAQDARTLLGTVYDVSLSEGIVLGREQPSHGRWPRVIQQVDIGALRSELSLPLLPYTVRLDPGQPDGYAREWVAYHGIQPERHEAYAFQWFGMAVLLAIIYLVTNTRRVRPASAEETSDNHHDQSR